MNTFPSRFKNVEVHSYSGHITASRWSPKTLCKPHCYQGGAKKSDACAHARVSVYKRKSNFAFFRRNGCFLVEQKDWKRGMPFLAIYDNKKQQNEMRKKKAPKETYKS
jgi:hypothetical protein